VIVRPTARVVVALCAALAMTGCIPGPPAPPHATTPAPTDPVDPFEGLDVEAGLSEVVADPVYPDYGNASLDVLAYGLDLAWDPDREELTGTATILLQAVRSTPAITLDFNRSYTVDGATVDGEPATASWAGSDLRVPHQLSAGARTTLVVRYHGAPETVPMPSQRGDFDEGLGLRVTPEGEVWTMQEPYGASTWYPANDMPSDEALYDIRVTVPEELSAVASGTLIGDTEGVFHWRSTDPVAAYLTTLAVGDYTKITDESADGVPLTYWLRTGVDDDYEPVARRSPELLSWLTERFGPYPFPSGGVVFVESESAMETQQMVTFGAVRGLGSLDQDGAAETLLHEYAHQWFGDAVTPTDWTGVWLNEGWAMYCELLWVVDQGFATEEEVLESARAIDADSRASAGPPGSFDPDRFAEANVYFGPALMLHAIHEQIGDDAFFALGRDWVQERRNTQVDRAEFTAFVNEQTGQDFTALIDTWLDSPTTPAS
jgi:aminopeptidase N